MYGQQLYFFVFLKVFTFEAIQNVRTFCDNFRILGYVLTFHILKIVW